MTDRPRPPESIRRHLDRVETNLPADKTLALNPKTVVTLFGAELLALLNRPRETRP